MKKNTFIDASPSGHELNPSRPGGRLCFKGGSSASSNDTSTVNTDRRIVNDGGLVLGGDVGQFDASSQDTNTNSGNTTITTTDSGAVKDAMGVVTHGQDVIGASYDRLVSGAENIFQDNSDSFGKLLDAQSYGSAAALSTAERGVTNAYGGFNSLLSVADRMFKSNDSNTATLREAVGAAYQTATAEKSGSIDNKTMLMLGLAGAAAVAIIAFKGK